LAVVRSADEASGVYADRLVGLCEELGVAARTTSLPGDTGGAVEVVEELGRDPEVAGVLVQLPLPEGVDQDAVVAAVDPLKDVDGVNPLNAGRLFLGLPALAPATPLAVMELLRRHDVDVAGKRAVVVGRSNITGKPVAMLLLHANATVTVCHSRTPDLGAAVREGEIVVACAGRAGLIGADMVAPGAVVVDVGTNFVDGKLVGDVRYDEVAEVAAAASPVPGGVGPLTNLMLVRNLLEASRPR
ncbi:MAG: bifunctional 5,10-methylenetetrahydrofolate dehydrogenase/5,10-methenyltetrahydrofolate cyclohydrolase, partial [Actinomycetota bacterium]|nr:bifunctional 5,10-methylenetetrahydrofolate dehydrogenase/5,10-methenyltetrahydrofolate cyclohydrolase [Actinomycetota bacterium]